ncbi:TetR/AcrR family transcriptional regulator [Spirillospora sp. CA-142024]|uniref:TetR/AcrR family transcriptional regulator n=1 Tax=Spirillospora sp. CA-142024 TaxID=3240036 RepID=UPI003D906772
MRSDTERNYRMLLRVAEEMLAHSDETVTLTQIAKEANIAPATAYRYFGSLDGLVTAFRVEVNRELMAFSEDCDAEGLDLLAAVCRRWVDLVDEHGHAMAQVRSREGYLTRLRAAVPDIASQAAAMRRPLAEAGRALGVPDAGDEALHLWNVLYDPRDILDLRATLGLSIDELAARLFSVLCAALTAWSAQPSPPADR